MKMAFVSSVNKLNDSLNDLIVFIDCFFNHFILLKVDLQMSLQLWTNSITNYEKVWKAMCS